MIYIKLIREQLTIMEYLVDSLAEGSLEQIVLKSDIRTLRSYLNQLEDELKEQEKQND